jgi:hypothetical protein
VKVFALDDDTRRAVFEVLAKVPEPVRAFGLGRVAVIGVGRGARGMALSRDALGPADWLVVLFERDGVAETAAHELAHAVSGHERGSVEAEVDAAGLAAAWGFTGDGADPVGCARRYAEAAAESAFLRPRAEGGRLGFECRCGAQCRLVCPTVPGRVALLALSCERCGWTVLEDLSDLTKCESCGERATVTWAEGATPERPTATWRCEGGHEVKRALVAAPDPPPVPDAGLEVPEEVWLMNAAARTLLTVEEILRRTEDRDPTAIESCRSGVWFAHARLRRAARVLAPDARGAILGDVAVEVAAAACELAEDDLMGAADALARATHTLNAVLESSRWLAGKLEGDRAAT